MLLRGLERYAGAVAVHVDRGGVVLAGGSFALAALLAVPRARGEASDRRPPRRPLGTLPGAVVWRSSGGAPPFRSPPPLWVWGEKRDTILPCLGAGRELGEWTGSERGNAPRRVTLPAL